MPFYSQGTYNLVREIDTQATNCDIVRSVCLKGYDREMCHVGVNKQHGIYMTCRVESGKSLLSGTLSLLTWTSRVFSIYHSHVEWEISGRYECFNQ